MARRKAKDGGKRRLAAPAGLVGPVVYCPQCHHKTGKYRPPDGQPGVPVAGQICGGCKIRALAGTGNSSSQSVRAISGGLPGLGKRR